MNADLVSLIVNKIAALGNISRIPLNKRRIITVGNEADVLTVGLVGVDKPCLTGALTDGGFVVFGSEELAIGSFS